MTSAAKHVVVVGGGISGLAAAYAAMERAREVGCATSVTVLEASDRFGGNLVTEWVDGFLLDGGPDSWVASKPQATALARRLGLGGELIGTNEATRRYCIAWKGRLHPVPEGLVLGVPTRLTALAGSGLFSWAGKLRMAMEPFVRARRFEGDDDESIADFARRRLGREAAERLVAPLLGGISAGDAGELSVRAAFPQLVAMERDYGSLVMGMRAAQKARAASGGPSPKAAPSAFVSLRGGVGTLAAALAARLETEGAVLRPGQVARSIDRAERGGFALRTQQGERIDADAVVLAIPGQAASSLLSGVDPDVSAALGEIAYGSTATVFMAYRRADLTHPLDGVGFVVPRSLGLPILASTWVSSKWAGRAPEGHALIRAFFGGPAGEGELARSDESLADLAGIQLRSLMGIETRPLWSRVFRFGRATAQMRVGHLAKMRAMRERLLRIAPGIRVAGGGYDGVGIPDCIRQGQDAGRALVDAAHGFSAGPQNSAGSL